MTLFRSAERKFLGYCSFQLQVVILLGIKNKWEIDQLNLLMQEIKQ